MDGLAAVPEVSAMARRIVRAVRPLQVILFGSQVRGDTHVGSDVDFLVVLPEGRDERQAWDQAYQALHGSPLPYDLVVSTVGRVRRLGHRVGTVFRPALREGRVLYDATAQHPWRTDGSLAHLEVDPVTDSDRLEETRLWLGQARDDLRLAEGGLTPQYLAPGSAGYMAQQAAEKALKAVLVFLQIDYPLTHNLDVVRDGIPPGWRVKEEHPALRWLTEWTSKGRYPGDWGPPTAQDAEAAVGMARAILDSVLRDLAERGFQAEELA
jgi:HEPN domain-containing protein